MALLIVTGVISILAGLTSITAQFLIVTYTPYFKEGQYYDEETWSTGFWAGSQMFLAGIFAIIYGRRRTPSLRISVLVFSCLSLGCSVAQIVIASIILDNIKVIKDAVGIDRCNIAFYLSTYCIDHLIFNGILIGAGVIGGVVSAAQLVIVGKRASSTPAS